MLHAFRTSVLALAFRRGIATVLAFCVCVAFAEPALADSCDDDARTPSSLVASTESGNGGTVMTARVNSAESPPLGTERPVHSIHVCHCAHAHIAPLARRESMPAPAPLLAFVRNVQAERFPLSVVRELQLRPPRMTSLA